MSEDHMNLSVNGQTQVPPGFRFHPTEEELLHYYLRKKVAYEKIDLDVIRDVDLNKLEPWDIQERCKIGSTPQNDWYFFSHKDKKYPTGTRTNRATAAGFWKATGRDKVIHSHFRRIGMRKTLVFYKGRAPHGLKSDWIMHEYRLDDNTHNDYSSIASNMLGESSPEEGWVVCRVFKKKNYQKVLESPQSSSSTSMDSRGKMGNLSNEGVLNQLLVYMNGRSCKQERETIGNNVQFLSAPMNNFDSLDQERFMHLPRLESTTTFHNNNDMFIDTHEPSCTNQSPDNNTAFRKNDGPTDWAALDRLVASQLNGHVDTSKPLSYYGGDPNNDLCFSIDDQDDHDDVQLSHVSNVPNQISQGFSSEIDDPWSFNGSASSDPLCHLSV